MNISLEHKTAVVCGSTQGIGLATAKELALLGATCILVARNAESLQQVILELPTPFAQQHNYQVADFADTKAVEQAAKDIAAKNLIHILVNNTGGPAGGPISDAEANAFINAFNQHLVCNHIMMQALIPGMKEAGYGRIINIISTSVKIPLPNLGVSNTIRGAVASWSKTLANELGSYGITVNNVLPGATETQRLKNIVATAAEKKQTTAEDITQHMQAEIPARRFGTAAEIANMAAFLASPAAAYVNGVSIPVDGGRTGSI